MSLALEISSWGLICLLLCYFLRLFISSFLRRGRAAVLSCLGGLSRHSVVPLPRFAGSLGGSMGYVFCYCVALIWGLLCVSPSGLMGSIFLIIFASALSRFMLFLGWVLCRWCWFEFFGCCIVDAGHFIGLGWVGFGFLGFSNLYMLGSGLLV